MLLRKGRKARHLCSEAIHSAETSRVLQRNAQFESNGQSRKTKKGSGSKTGSQQHSRKGIEGEVEV